MIKTILFMVPVVLGFTLDSTANSECPEFKTHADLATLEKSMRETKTWNEIKSRRVFTYQDKTWFIEPDIFNKILNIKQGKPGVNVTGIELLKSQRVQNRMQCHYKAEWHPAYKPFLGGVRTVEKGQHFEFRMTYVLD